MIYEDEIVFLGKLEKYCFNPVEIWEELGGFLKHRGFLGDLYKVDLGMKKSGSNDLGYTKSLSTEEVSKNLSADEGVPILSAVLPKPNKIGMLQFLSYHQKHGSLSLSGKLGHFPDEWDSFFMTAHLGERIVNGFIRTADYIDKFREYRNGSNCDLLKAPGLTNDRGDYLEGVAAEMWFGESFWQYASCTKEDLKACDWLKCDDRNFQLHVEAWDGSFTSAEGEQGEVQRELLKMLFGIGK